MVDPVPPDAQPPQPVDGRMDEPASGGRWRVPLWALGPAVMAPVLLVAGLIVAPELQPPGFDSIHSTISALAARDAVDRGVMSAVLVGLGLAYITTAIALAGVGLVGRVLLGVGGLSTALVAAFPLPRAAGTSVGHAMCATFAVLAISSSPVAVVPRRADPTCPLPGRMRVAVSSTVVLYVLAGWFGLELYVGGARIGLSERIAAVAQATWPLFVVVTARATQRREGEPSA